MGEAINGTPGEIPCEVKAIRRPSPFIFLLFAFPAEFRSFLHFIGRVQLILYQCDVVINFMATVICPIQGAFGHQ
jgi:hypothetical protein